MWHNSVLSLSETGTTRNPQLIFALRDRLQTRLGLRSQDTQPNGQSPSLVLKVVVEPIERSLVAEDRSGRADQYLITIRARPVVEGRPEAPVYPMVQGTASYYESRVSTSVQATRRRAEAEAVERLTDTLVAVLSSDFSP